MFDCVQTSLFDLPAVEEAELVQEESESVDLAIVLDSESNPEPQAEVVDQPATSALPVCPLLIACLDLLVRPVPPSPAADWFSAKVSYYRQMQIKIIEAGIAETNANGGTPILKALERRRNMVCYLQTFVDEALHQLAKLGESDAT